MYTNNSYGIRFIDLSRNGDIDQNFYKYMKEYLNPIRDQFFMDDDVLWNQFVERFTDHYYNRWINFITYHEFRIKLKELFRQYRYEFLNNYLLSIMDIDPLKNYEELVNYDGTLTSNGIKVLNTAIDTKNNVKTTTESKGTGKSTSEGTTSNNTTNEGYNLHSDTPQDNINIKNMFSNSNYVTSADNDQSSSNSKGTSTDKTDTSTTDNTTSTTTGGTTTSNTGEEKSDTTNSNIYKILSTGYHGDKYELLEKFSRINYNAINTIFDKIDQAHLFQSILY